MVTYSYPYFSALWWHCARVWSFSWWRLYRHNMLPRHLRRWHTLCILSGFVEYTSHFRAILRFSPPSLPRHLDSKMWQWISVLFSHLRWHVMFVNLCFLSSSGSKSLVCLILSSWISSKTLHEVSNWPTDLTTPFRSILESPADYKDRIWSLNSIAVSQKLNLANFQQYK